MLNRYSYYLWLGVLFFALIISFYFLQATMNQPKLIQHSKFTPDLYASNITMLETDDQGHWKHQIRAEALTHYTDKNHSVFSKPIITILRPEQQPWIIHADAANAYEGSDVVTLTGHVRARQAAGEHNDSTLILTEAVTIERDNDIATSDQHVRIITPDSQIDADGMRVHLHDKRVKLLANVRGYYAKNAQN